MRQNGFDFRDGDGGGLLLTAVPFSKDVTFGPTDVQELSQLLRGGAGAGQGGRAAQPVSAVRRRSAPGSADQNECMRRRWGRARASRCVRRVPATCG